MVKMRISLLEVQLLLPCLTRLEIAASASLRVLPALPSVTGQISARLRRRWLWANSGSLGTIQLSFQGLPSGRCGL